jgi:hypothetical protein
MVSKVKYVESVRMYLRCVAPFEIATERRLSLADSHFVIVAMDFSFVSHSR